MQPLLIDKLEACRVLSIGMTKLHELLSAGSLEVVHIGKATRITTVSIQAYVAGLMRGVQPEASNMMRRAVRGLPHSAAKALRHG